MMQRRKEVDKQEETKCVVIGRSNNHNNKKTGAAER